jgi:hypothetical protein
MTPLGVGVALPPGPIACGITAASLAIGSALQGSTIRVEDSASAEAIAREPTGKRQALRAGPTVSAIVAPRDPIGFGEPAVVSRAV